MLENLTIKQKLQLFPIVAIILVLIKFSFTEVGEYILQITRDNISEINALGFGWLLALIMQSSGAATSALLAMNFAGIIGPIVLIYMVIGTRIGTTLTALFVSLFISAKRRDFRHGFEIGLCRLSRRYHRFASQMVDKWAKLS